MEQERKTRTEVEIEKLAETAGSAEALSRGRFLAVGIVIFGMIGAVGAALRPLYRHHFRQSAQSMRSAGAARRAIAFERDGSATSADAERLLQAKQRLDELKARHPQL